jgi:hypothetical protein
MVSMHFAPLDFDSRAAYAAARALRFKKNQPTPGEISERIGPWTVVEQGGGFIWRLDEKPSTSDIGRFCTRRSIIERKPQGVYRVVLIGESASGSYGYWGQFNLATEI